MAHPVENKWCILKNNELLRQLLFRELDRRQLTDAEVAKMTGVPRWQVSSYRKGEKEISQFSLVKLANWLGFEIKLDISVKNPYDSSVGGNPSAETFPRDRG